MISKIRHKGPFCRIRQLDIEMIAPQHGAFFRGKPMVEQFISWCANLECGVDLLPDAYELPR